MRRLLIWMFAAVMLAGGVSAQDGPIIISLPIHGQLAYSGNLPGTRVGPGDNQLFTIDTFSGEVDILMQRDIGILSPAWGTQGDNIAILNFHPDPALGVFNIGTRAYSDIVITPGVSLYPQSWSPDGNQILSISFSRASGPGQLQLQLVNVGSGTITPLFTYVRDSLVTDVPLPTGISNFTIRDIRQAEWNPVYPEWILVQYSGYDSEVLDTTSGYPVSVEPAFLYNLQTDEKLSINLLFSSPINGSPIRWSPDGRQILLGTNKDLNSTAVIRFQNTGGTWGLQVVDEVRTMDEAAIDWLGISDLMLTAAGDPTDDSVFNIAQIIDGVWHTTEFIRIPAGTFERKREEDWHLDATNEEKRALICLFDQAMPMRLSLGSHARVNFTNGTSLRLRDAPDFDATEITQMPEGTAFDVIGGPACVNGDSYYRFWQVELADGTIGWAAEADNDDYFMEPAEGR